MRAVMDRLRRGRNRPASHGHGGHRRHAGRDVDRPVPDTGDFRCRRETVWGDRSRGRVDTVSRGGRLKMRASCLSIVAALLTGCTFGPTYKRPQVSFPAKFGGPEPLPAPQAASFADLKWFEVFQDEKLQDLIRTA